MREADICNGDVVNVVDKGEALVIWKGFNNQPLIAYMSELKSGYYSPVWSAYENFDKVVDHIDICQGFNYIFNHQ